MAAERPKGVSMMRSSVVKKIDPSVATAFLHPVPTGSLEAQDQPFQGAAPASAAMSTKKKAVIEQGLENPLLQPIGASLSKKERLQSTKKAIPSSIKPAKPSTTIHLPPKDTPNIQPREDGDSPLAPDVLSELDNISPLFAEYKLAQFQTESANPYLTDTVIYTPQTSKSFYRFIDDNYENDFRLKEKLKGQTDPDACNKLQMKTDGKSEAFLYQQFIREYIRTASPYRGILVYHGLGSGKTCSSIAAAEALYGTGNKKIIVMTPFSLRGNFLSEISFCGFRHYNLYNHWVEYSLDSYGSVIYLFAKSVLSLPDDYLRRVLRRPDPSRRVIWLPDYSQPVNYSELPSEFQNEIRMQITTMIESRITFINYNGVGPKQLMKYACEKDADGNRMFDNAVIVIDEFHNMTRLMHGNIVQYITERKGRPRKIPVEPIEPGKWEPKLCNSELAYSRGFLFYRLLSDARNSKIIGLTGTPIINFPEELGILSNVLAGYMECAEFEIRETKTERLELIRRVAEEESRVDMIRFQKEDLKTKVLISTFLEGYERVSQKGTSAGGSQVEVRYRAEAQDNIRDIFPRIQAKLRQAGIQMVGQETYVSYPRLPVDDEKFRSQFVNTADLSIKNKITLQKRLTGLISYYKGANEDYMPRVKKDVLVECIMSDYTLKMYTDARKSEIEGEQTKKKEPAEIFAMVEMFAKMGSISNYRFRSRALCNFAFPESIKRPFPNTPQEEKAISKVEMEGINEDVDVTEASFDELSAEDKIAIEQVKKEEMQVVLETKEEVKEVPEIKEVTEETEETEEKQEGGAGEDEEISISRRKKSAAKAPVVEAPISAAKASQMMNISAAAEIGKSMKRDEKKKIIDERIRLAKERKEMKSMAAATAAAAGPSVVTPSAAAAASKPQFSKEVITYQERIRQAMNELNVHRNDFLNLDDPIEEKRLVNYSSKLDHMLRHLNESRGSNLVYSQFKTVEGLGVLAIALRANGYSEIRIEGSDDNPSFSKETIESLRKGPQAKEKRFIMFTGDGSKERRSLILNIFNGNFDKLPLTISSVLREANYVENANKYGEICWVIGITGAGAEGISLKCCRSVHIMEPYWNNVRLDQVKGRAIRICSHKDLPYEERDVEIYTYCTIFSKEQLGTGKVDLTLIQTDNGNTSDQKVYNVSKLKDTINQEILQVMKEAAVDCGINAADNDGVQCFRVADTAKKIQVDSPNLYMFDPNLTIDIAVTNMYFADADKLKAEAVTESKQEEVWTSAMKPATAATAATSADTIQIQVIEYDGVEYCIAPNPSSPDTTYNIYERRDVKLSHPIGYAEVDPTSLSLSFLSIQFTDPSHLSKF